jgi:hypothetical protein
MNPTIGSSSKLAFWVGVIVIIGLLLTMDSTGLTEGEPAAIAASESYIAWVGRLIAGPHGVLNQQVIRNAWEPNHQTAPLNEVYSGAVWSVARYLLDDLSAHRLGNIVLAGALAAFLFRMMSVEFGFWAGFASVIALFTMPRFFYHAHLVATDVPAAAAMIITTYLFWRNKESARLRYILLMGFAFGFTVATDLRAVVLLPVLLLWVLIFRLKLYLILRMLLSILIAALVVFLFWPWLYYDTVSRVTTAVQSLSASAAAGPFWYLGQIYASLPWHFPFVILWAVIPAGTILLMLAGLVRTVLSRRARPFGILLLMLVLFPVGILATGKLAMAEDERILLPVFPFLAALAGMGFAWLIQGIHVVLRKTHQPAITAAAAVIVCLLCFAPPVYQSITLFPHLLSYYSEQVGGLAGARGLGMTTTYGCDACREAIPYINQAAGNGDTLWVDADSLDIMLYYRDHGILKDDIALVIPADSGNGALSREAGAGDIPDFSTSDLILLQHRENQLTDVRGQPTGLADWASARQPGFRLERQGATLLEVFLHT